MSKSNTGKRKCGELGHSKQKAHCQGIILDGNEYDHMGNQWLILLINSEFMFKTSET